MDEKKNVVQLISSETIEDYIKLTKVTSYRYGFGDGVKATSLLFGCGLLTLATIAGAVGVGYLLNKELKNGGNDNGHEQLS